MYALTNCLPLKQSLYFLMVVSSTKNESRQWEVSQELCETENPNNKIVDKFNGSKSIILQQKQSFESRSMGCKLTWQERDSEWWYAAISTLSSLAEKNSYLKEGTKSEQNPLHFASWFIHMKTICSCGSSAKQIKTQKENKHYKGI